MEECRQEVIHLHCKNACLNCWYVADTLDVEVVEVNGAEEEAESDVGCVEEVAAVEAVVDTALPLSVVEEEAVEMHCYLDDVLQLHTYSV